MGHEMGRREGTWSSLVFFLFNKRPGSWVRGWESGAALGHLRREEVSEKCYMERAKDRKSVV